MLTIAPLDQLVALDRTLLYVFVAGPGYGEGVAVALPEIGWLLVDGCTVDRAVPLLSIYQRWRSAADNVDCLVLTHPHKDHAMGFRRVLEETLPRRVGLTAPPSDPDLALDVLAPGGAGVTSDDTRRRTVVDALGAIRRYASATPGALMGLCQGVEIPTATAGVAVTTRSPPELQVGAAYAAARIAGEFDPNELSAVIEVTFGATRVVLGSDLTTPGWNYAIDAHPALTDHHGLKVPHHGSPTAHHDGLMAPGPNRAWMVSPFSPAHLPPVHADGIPWLVERNGALYLTAAPLARYRQPLPPPTVPLANLTALFAGAGAPPGTAVAAVSPPLGLRALDAVWAAAFGSDGTVRGLWRGPRAFAVTP